MSRRLCVVLGSLLVAGLPGCGKASPTSSSSSSSSASTVNQTVTPDPATAEAYNQSGYVWTTSFNVTLSQTGGSGAVTIRSVNADLQQAAGGIVVDPPANTDEAFRFQVKATGNTLPADGTVAIDFDFAYTLPNGGREALVTINFILVDASGTSSTKTVQVRVV
jgi:hypothetical protein